LFQKTCLLMVLNTMFFLDIAGERGQNSTNTGVKRRRKKKLLNHMENYRINETASLRRTVIQQLMAIKDIKCVV